ncbi:MAG: DUF2889 domain-containing protein [Pseudomonadota bacterium]|nr:DUF2889 domain-containing protein [Pseudomonadota bacterium]
MRRITCEGFERDDGLWDIEGTLLDTKPTKIELVEKTIPAGEPIHRMMLRLTIDRERVIRDVHALTLDSPHKVCGNIAASYRQLIGLRVEPGFTKTAKRMFRGILGCSHLTELLPPMATTAFQILWSDAKKTAEHANKSGRRGESPLGGCHALRLDGEVVAIHFRHLLPASDAAPDAAAQGEHGNGP